MSATRRLAYLSASLAVCGGLVLAQSNEPVTAPATTPSAEPAWLASLWSLPVLKWLTSWQSPVDPPQVAIETPPPPPCWISPLQPVEDAEAVAMEHPEMGGSPLNLDGLTARTSKALSRFENLVQARGGTFLLTSAYRPATYQSHLRDVWYKWVYELKDNSDPACVNLKAQVGDEFARHGLLLSQHPVPVSDHTLGIGFDAAITMPLVKTKRTRRPVAVSIDRIARLSGVSRPDIRHDPVHFRLIGARRIG